jgi:uncharacterized membrane protein
VIGTGVRLLDVWVQTPEDDGPRPPRCDRLLGPGIAADDLLEDLFGPIARYGAGDLAVAMRLQKGLAALAATPQLAEPVAVLAQAAVERSRAALPIEADIRRLEAVALAR